MEKFLKVVAAALMMLIIAMIAAAWAMLIGPDHPLFEKTVYSALALLVVEALLVSKINGYGWKFWRLF